MLFRTSKLIFYTTSFNRAKGGLIHNFYNLGLSQLRPIIVSEIPQQYNTLRTLRADKNVVKSGSSSISSIVTTNYAPSPPMLSNCLGGPNRSDNMGAAMHMTISTNTGRPRMRGRIGEICDVVLAPIDAVTGQLAMSGFDAPAHSISQV